MSVSDNATIADLGDEEEGFWDPIHAQVDKWLTRYAEAQEDDGDITD